MIDWGQLLEKQKRSHQNRIQHLSPSASGKYIHSMLEDEYGDIDFLDFEQNVSSGRADCIGEDLVYEFKTKSQRGIDSAPYKDNFEQLQKYLNSPDVDQQEGQVVYINREDLSDVKQYHFKPNYDTDIVADGGLPDLSEYSVYQVLLED